MSVWYTAPTAIRMLMKAGAELARALRASRALRFIASVGEPLNPEAVWWGKEVLGLPIHDNWWQTETGGIMIANNAGAWTSSPARWGGRCRASRRPIVRRARGRRGRGRSTTPDVEGELALRAGWPSMFRGYLGEEERYRKCFAGGWYLTGDLAQRDADGYFWFVGRADDVIKSAGHLIGPFEVESALMEHPAVAEAGVIGKPDPVVGEIVKAFVSLKPGFEPERGAALRAARPRAQAPGRGGRAQGDRVPAGAAAHAQRQDHAPAAQGARARACPRATRRRWRAGHEHAVDAPPSARVPFAREHSRSQLLARHAAHPPLRGALRRALQRAARSAASCTCTSARRRWPPARCTRCAPRTTCVATYREHGHALRAGVPMNAHHGRDVRQARRLHARPRRLDAPVRRRARASTAATPSSAAACRWPWAWRWPTSCSGRARASPPASSATARWPRASSTSR